MNREIHVRFWEGLGVRFPRATHWVLPPPKRCLNDSLASPMKTFSSVSGMR